MEHWLVVSYHCFGTTYWCHLQGSSSPIPWPFKMELIGCPKMSVTNYQSVLHNIPEEWRSHLCNSRCQKSCTQQNYLFGILHVYTMLWSIEVKERKDVAQKSHSLSLHHQVLLFIINVFVHISAQNYGTVTLWYFLVQYINMLCHNLVSRLSIRCHYWCLHEHRSLC